MQTHRKLGWVLTTVVLLAGAACGADTSPPAEQSAVSQSPVPTVKQSSGATRPAAAPSASEYFELLSTNDSDNAAKAAELAAPKSLAAAYATHLAAVRGANEDGGNAEEADDLTVDGDVYQSCAADQDSDDCTRWSGATFKDGRIASLTVNGKDISGRLTLGSGDKVAAGKLGNVKFVSAYKSIASDALFVTGVVDSNKEKITLGTYSASYRDRSGKQVTAYDGGGPGELDADSNTRIVMIFSKAKVGGMVTLEMYDDSGYVTKRAKFRVG